MEAVGLDRRREANASWFAAEADRLAHLCRAMAARFARGGRLLATGDVSDARHVAVEFVHPVIVGKRALPALAVSARRLELLAEPDDMVIGFGADVSSLAARGCLVIDLDPPVDDPFVHQELVETAYHVLWELVHVFLEHSERTVHDTGAASFLYPFLGERETDEDAVLEDVRRSILMKAEETGALREQTLTEGRETLIAAAEAMRGGRPGARSRQRRLGHGRDGPGGRPRARGPPGDRPHRRPGDPHRDRQRRRRRGDLRAPGDRARARRRRAGRRSPPAAARRT